jgi:hypothetical protein
VWPRADSLPRAVSTDFARTIADAHTTEGALDLGCAVHDGVVHRAAAFVADVEGDVSALAAPAERRRR